MMDRPSFDRLSAAGGGEAIVRGITFRELERLSSAILSRGAPDATSGVRPWDDTVFRVAAGWKRLHSPPGEPGWIPADGGAWREPGDL